jgi:hypothetical protein
MQYQELQEYDHASFTDRMADGRDAADRDRRRLAYLGSRVSYALPKLVIWLSSEDAAAQLGVIERRVRALCKQRRIPGARRIRTGKGRPWQIPAHRQPDGEYRVIVTPKTLGPPLRSLLLSPGDLPI